MKLLIIKDWNKHFENNRTRGLQSMSWVPFPNKQDGDGYTILMSYENGAEILGCWVAIVQVASKCTPRGPLIRGNGKPHDADSLSRVTRIEKTMLRNNIKILCDSELGWLEVVDFKEETDLSALGCHHPAGGCLEGKGREGKGTEGKKSNRKLTEAQKKRKKVSNNSDLMIQIGDWFGRKSDTLWSLYESEALDDLGDIPEHELETMKIFYEADIPQTDDFRRRNIETLLNNWNGELDKAAEFRRVKGK